MKKISVNQFNKGLNLDNNPVSVSNDSLIGALNATFVTKNGNEVVLQNDMGNASVDKAQLPAGYVPLGAKEYGGIIYVASYNPLTDESQIGCFPSPQRNFSTDSKNQLQFKSLCEYIENGIITSTYEQKIIKTSDDNIIRPGDKFLITATSDQIADFENYSQYIRLKVLVVTSDNQSIDITNEVVEPSENFAHVKFIKKIEENTNNIQDSDYTVYTNRTCGQLCLRAELIIPNRIELLYFAEYKKISEIFPENYQTTIDDWTNNQREIGDLITPDTYVTKLHVKVVPYDENGEIFTTNRPSYESDVTISNGGYIYNYLQSNTGDFYYLIFGESNNSIINFNYTPEYIYPPNTCIGKIESLKKSESVELSLIGSGRVTFNTFRYFNDFDNNYLVFNYGIKFYQRNSDHELTNLYLELINLKDLNNVSWNYNDVNKKRIALDTNNTYGIYTETISYLSILDSISFNNSSINVSFNNDDKITIGQYYIARICAEVNGTALYKSDWHALLTSDATNYIYSSNESDMLNLSSSQELLLNYDIIENNNDIIENEQIELTGEDNYFVLSEPISNEMKYEVKKSGTVRYIHEATADLIIPRYFPFLENEISYDSRISCHINGTNFPINYQDNIVTEGTYITSNKVKHYNNITIKHGENIGGNDSSTISERNGKNKLSYTATPAPNDSRPDYYSIGLSFNYELYSQLISPFSPQRGTCTGTMPAFIPYASRLTDLLKSSYVNDSDSRIYPEKMLYCFYMNSTPRRSKIGICDYVRTNSDSFSPSNDIPLIDGTGYHQCRNFEISNFLNNYLEDPNIVIFSSCVDNSSKITSSDTSFQTYDMLLLKGIDGNLYLTTEIQDDKGVLLQFFNYYFKNIYVYTPNQNVNLTYWIGNRTNYFATNDYRIHIDYNVNYQKLERDSNIQIVSHDNSESKILDQETIYLPNIKFNSRITTKHFEKTIYAYPINELVDSFINSNTLRIENIAKINENTYKLNAWNGNIRTPLNSQDCYVWQNNKLINCKDYDTSQSTTPFDNIVQKIKDNLLVLNDKYELVLNNDSIPNVQNYWHFGAQSAEVWLSPTLFPNSFKDFKLFNNA